MRVVICADAHLDSVSPLYINNKKLGEMRNEDARKAFTRVIEKTRETSAELLLIAGDLFDASRVTEQTISFLCEAFTSIPNTFVCIAPGNADAALPNSYYCNPYIWPANVYIYTGSVEAIELEGHESGEKVRVYGAGFRSPLETKPMLEANSIPDGLDSDYINILLMHASLGKKSGCNPLNIEMINKCGFDFCALGHEHLCSGVVATTDTFYAYPGACEERRFPPQKDAKDRNSSDAPNNAQTQITRGGILYGEIKKKYNNLSFLDVSTRHHYTGTLDITNIESVEKLKEAILLKFPVGDDLYRITLTGMLSEGLRNISMLRLNEELSHYYFYIKITMSATPKRYDSDGVPRRTGDYIAQAADAMRNNADNKVPDDVICAAVRYAVTACEGGGFDDEN